MLSAMQKGGYGGALHLVNPRYDTIEGLPCVGSLHDLETPPDLVVIGVGGHHVEQVFDEAVAVGARSVSIFDACHGEARGGGKLIDYLRARAEALKLPVCGGNGMGFINATANCHATFYDCAHLKPGGISLIAHSGSVFTVLALNDLRYRFNLVISAGQEIGTRVDDYLDYALDQPETRVVAIFMEAARNPDGLARALGKAQARGVPVVVCKVGRTEDGARLAQSHSGAIAGNDAAYDALFDRYGVVRADTVDQLMNTALLLDQGRAPGAGALGIVTDSGGLRETLVDRAHECGVAFAKLSPQTTAQLAAALPEGLVAENPVDAAGSISVGFSKAFGDSLSILGSAREVAMLGYEFDVRDDYVYSSALREYADTLADMTDKPCFFYSSFGNANNKGLADFLADRNVPTLNGMDEMFSAVKRFMRWYELRARQAAREDKPEPDDEAASARWRSRLTGANAVSEADGLALLADFGVPAVRHLTISDGEGLDEVEETIGYPVVLKTAAPGIAHKSDVGGVHLDITDIDALKSAYAEMLSELGPKAVAAQMAPSGVEIALGCVNDPEFGPVVMVGAGGVLVEHLADHAHALAPFGVEMARELIDRLKVRRLLAGLRGAPPCDVEALAVALSRFSVLCAELADCIAEIDVNPLIVSQKGCVAVDALIVPR
jgi:acetyltransferase